jgi:hypothetical protein
VRILAPLVVLLASAALAAPAAAQYEFDVVGFGRVQVDDATFGLSSGWLVLVNTGAVAIPLVEWADALHFAELDTPVGGFDLEPVFAGPTTLAPGQAIGAFDAVLLNELRMGESFVNAAATRFTLSPPWPAGSVRTLRWSFVLGDRRVDGATELEFTSTPSTFGVSAQRITARPTDASVVSLPSGCQGTIRVRPQALPTPFRIAPSSDLPVLGNRCFALDVRVNNLPYLLGVDLASGAQLVAGCQGRLGLTRAFSAILYPGNIVLRMPIPNQAVLLGQQVYLQVAGVSGGSITTLTNALAITLGARP